MTQETQHYSKYIQDLLDKKKLRKYFGSSRHLPYLWINVYLLYRLKCFEYRNVSNIRRTKYQNLNAARLIL